MCWISLFDQIKPICTKHYLATTVTKKSDLQKYTRNRFIENSADNHGIQSFLLLIKCSVFHLMCFLCLKILII